MTAASTYLDALARIAAPEWLSDSRRASLDQFLAAGLPGHGEEEWKYTSLDPLARIALHTSEAGADSPACPDLSAYPGHALAFQNGRMVCHGTYLISQLAGSLQGMADTQVVQAHLGRVAGDTALVKLNHALWQDGARIYIPSGEKLALPIFVIHAAGEAEAMFYPRTLAVLESGGEAILVEHYLGQTDAPYWQNAVTEIVLEAGARLTHIRLVEEGPAATHTGLTAVRLGEGSEYRCLHLGLGGALVRHDLTADLSGADARLRVDALDVTDGRRHADLHLRIEHQAARTGSRITYRSLADGRGRAVFDGRVIVRPGAGGTDAIQSCRGLLLSPHAEIDAKPQLEIFTDDVKCSHGVSVGQLDEDALFYLRSRGIDADEARRLLLLAFAEGALSLLDETRLRDWAMPKILARLSLPSREDTKHER